MGFLFGSISYLISKAIKLSLFLAGFAAIILLIPNLPPYTKFSSIKVEPTQPSVGPLEVNGALNNVEKLYKDKLLGPEAFQLFDGEVYTSVATGEVLKLSPGGHVTFVTKLGQTCSGLIQEDKCGRPLGIQIDEKNRQLYVADAYHGIWKVDLKTDKKQQLVSPNKEIEGRKPRLFNGIALANNGDIFWTDSSSEFPLKDGSFIGLVDPSGRLFHYNAAKKENKVLLDDLWFPNGIVISPDNQFLVVAETLRYRLLKYYIDGPKKGKVEVFIDGLPGSPDNMRSLPDGSGVLVGLYTVFNDENPLITRSLSETPLARKFIARLLRLVEIPFEFFNSQFPNPVFEDIVYNIGHIKTLHSILPGTSGLVQIDWNGKVVASYYNTDGSLGAVSDAIVFNDKLLIGSPHKQNFVGAVPAPPLLKKAFASIKSSPSLKTAETVTKEIPKPKVESKPQAKPVEASKQKLEEKPKVEERKETPKVVKPVAQEKPKPTQQAKPAEPVKVSTPKPEEKKPTPEPKAKPTQPPSKPTESKTTTPKPPQTKPVTPEPAKPTTPPPKQTEPKAAKTPKTETKPKVEKPAATKPPQTPPEDKTKKPSNEAKKPAKENKKAPEQIPITEEIPSDTRKPNKETLKVITKSGPAEIPNPEL